MVDPIEPVPFAAEGPQPLLREIPPGAPYPVEALGLLRTVVEAVHDISQAPVAIAAQSALAVASFATQAFANVEILGIGTSPVSLFVLTIAESGERKSTCDRLVMQGAKDHEHEQVRAYAPARTEYDTAKDIWDARRRGLVAAVSGKNHENARNAETDLRNMETEPFSPLVPHRLIQEPTIEGVMKLFQAGEPSLGLFSDEAGGFIGGHAMNTDNRLKTISHLSKFWDGDPVNRSRSGDGCDTFYGRRLAIHLMAQPVAVRPLLADPVASGQGFLARFILTEPASAIGTRLRRNHDPASERAIAIFTGKLRTVLQAHMPAEHDRQELTPRTLPLSREAKELVQRYYEAVEKAQAQGGQLEHVRAYASKSAEQACRMAGVLTLWSDLNAPEVTAETMADAVQLAQFYLGEAKRLSEAGSVSAETARAEALRKWLVESWPQHDVTPRDITRMGPNSLRERAKLKEPLAMLVRTGWLVPLEAGAVVDGKPRKEAYRIVRPGNAV